MWQLRHNSPELLFGRSDAGRQCCATVTSPLFDPSPHSHGAISATRSGPGVATLNLFRTSLIAVPFLASLAPCSADPAPVTHSAPAENLEHVDEALIDRAEHEINLAAHVLSDWPVMQALTPAASLQGLASTPQHHRVKLIQQLIEFDKHLAAVSRCRRTRRF